MNNNLKVYLRKHVFYGHMSWLLWVFCCDRVWSEGKQQWRTNNYVGQNHLYPISPSDMVIVSQETWEVIIMSIHSRVNYTIVCVIIFISWNTTYALKNFLVQGKRNILIIMSIKFSKQIVVSSIEQVKLDMLKYFWKVSFIGDNNLTYFIHILLRF